MAFTQGAPLPNITETTTTTQDAPAYYDQLLAGLSGAGTTALAKTPQQLVAGLDPLQQQAYGITADKAASYVPGMTAASTDAASAAKGITPEMIQSFMNPYTQNVNDELRRQADLNWTRNVMPALRGNFVSTGGVGGRRYAGALGQTLAENQADLLGAQSKNLNLGYQSALDTAAKQASLLGEGAKTEADIASQMQALGLKETGALQAAGANQQAYQQSLLDAPLKTAANVAPLLEKYKVPTGTTQAFTGPKAGAYQNSTLQNITGLAALLGSATTGTAATRLKDLYTSITGGGSTPLDLGGGLKLNPDGSISGTSPDGAPMSQSEIDALIFGPNPDATSSMPIDTTSGSSTDNTSVDNTLTNNTSTDNTSIDTSNYPLP